MEHPQPRALLRQVVGQLTGAVGLLSSTTSPLNERTRSRGSTGTGESLLGEFTYPGLGHGLRNAQADARDEDQEQAREVDSPERH